MAHTTTCPSCHTTFRVTAEQLLARDGNVRCGRCNHVFNAHQSLELNYPPLTSLDETLTQEEYVAALEFSAPVQPAPPAVIDPKPEPESEPEPKPEPEPEPPPKPGTITVVSRPREEAPPPTKASSEEPLLELPLTFISEAEAEADAMHSDEPLPDFVELISEFAQDFKPEPVAQQPDQPPTAEIVEYDPFPEVAEPPKVVAPPDAVDLPEITKVLDAGEPLNITPSPDAGNSLDEQAQSLWNEVRTTPNVPYIAAADDLPEVPAPPSQMTIAEAPLIQPAALKTPANLRWLWLVGSSLLLLALLAQSALYFRTELAAYNPKLRPLLEQVCASLGCRVPLPQNPDLLSIETSSLEAVPNQPGIIVLQAVPRNRAPYTQTYPTLELTLTDDQDQPLARRLFQPEEYLPKGTAVKDGMPPSDEIDVKLTFDLGEIKASGYKVYLFYPSPAS